VLKKDNAPSPAGTAKRMIKTTMDAVGTPALCNAAVVMPSNSMVSANTGSMMPIQPSRWNMRVKRVPKVGL
jgi:hypothetical protein